MSEAPTPPANRHARRFAMLVVLTYAISFGIVAPVLPDLIRSLAKVEVARAALIGGLMNSIYGLAQFLLSPLVGALGDRFGRRPVILIVLVALVIDSLLLAVAPTVGWLFLGRFVAGGLGAVFAPAQALVADVTRPDERASGFGALGAAFGVGFVVGPAIGGLLARFGLRAPFLAAAALAALVLLYGLVALKETLPVERRRPLDWRRANPIGAFAALRTQPAIVPVAGAIFLWLLAVNLYPALWSFHAIERFGWSPTMLGVSFSLVGLSLALAQALAIKPMVGRFGTRTTILIGLSWAATAFTINAINPIGWLALVFAALVGIQGVVQPSLSSLLSARVPADRQGEILGLGSSLAALAILLAPLMYNPAFEYLIGPDSPAYLPGGPFLIAAALSVACAVLVSRMREEPA